MLLHDGEDLDNDLGGRSDEDLSLSSSLGVDDVVLQNPVSNLIVLVLSFSDIIPNSIHFSSPMISRPTPNPI